MNREVLWGNMNRDSEMYQFVKILVDLRKSVELWNKPQVQRYADDHFYAFTRDYVLALFTNTDDIISRTITSHSFTEGSKLCNALDKNDCIFVNLGKINVTLNGEPKVYLLSMKKDKKMHIHNDISKKNHSNAEEKLKYLK
jgi:alpha-amylase